MTPPTLEVEPLPSGEYDAREFVAAALPWEAKIMALYGECADRHQALIEFIKAGPDAD